MGCLQLSYIHTMDQAGIRVEACWLSTVHDHLSWPFFNIAIENGHIVPCYYSCRVRNVHVLGMEICGYLYV